MVVLTGAGLLREWSQGVLRPYCGGSQQRSQIVNLLVHVYIFYFRFSSTDYAASMGLISL